MQTIASHKSFFRDKRFLLAAILLLGLIFKLYGFHKVYQLWWDENRYRGYLPIAFFYNGRLQDGMNALFKYSHGRPMFSIFYLIPGLFAALVGFIWNTDFSFQLAVFYNGIIWTATTYLIYRIAQNYLVKDNPRFALIPAFFLAINMACTIHSRNLFPATAGIFLFVLAVNLLFYADRKNRNHLFFLLGILSGLGITVYNGYYIGGFFLFSYFLFLFQESPILTFKRISFCVGGTLLPLFFFQILSRFFGQTYFGDYFGSMQHIATTIVQGDFSEGWIFYFKYFWATDGVLSLVVWAFLLFGGYLFFADRENRNFKIIYLGVVLILINHIILSSVLKKMVIYGRLVVFTLPFIILTASFEFNWLYKNGFRRFFTPLHIGVAAFLMIAMAVGEFYPVYRSRYPLDDVQAFLDKGSYRLVPFQKSYRDYIEMLEYKIHTQQIPPLDYLVFGLRLEWLYMQMFEHIQLPPLYKYPHPFSFSFRQYQGMTPETRRLVNQQDLSIKIYRYNDIKKYYKIGDQAASTSGIKEAYVNLDWWPLTYKEYKSAVNVAGELSLNDLPSPLKEKVIYNKGASRLLFLGKMSQVEKSVLKNIFPSKQDKHAIDILFEKTQHVF